MNVRDVEFARGYRLSVNAIMPISFTVPRVKSTFFQDDIFPPTRVLWTPACSGSVWLEGNAIMPISFTVPRVKSTFFQDDIFPPTRVLWPPACSGSVWLEGNDYNPVWISLKPADMPALSNGLSIGPTTQNKIMSQTQKPNIKTNLSLTKDEA